MKLLVELRDKNINEYKNIVDGIILALSDFSVLNEVSYTLEEIKKISEEYTHLDIFVKLDKNIFNDEIDRLKEVLIFLDKLNIKGIFFYDLAVLELKKSLHLNIDLVWSQTHMVTNYRTCNYYFEKGCTSALLSKEITLEEILEIKRLSKISVMVEVLSLPSVAYSRRKLVTNYNHDIGNDSTSVIDIVEKVTNSNYKVVEEKSGTGFILNNILNGTGVIKELYDNGIDYILMRESGIDDFLELIKDTKSYIDSNCNDTRYVDKYKKLGDNTGFFFRKTVYRVKK